MRIGTGAVLLVLGAILYSAVDVDVPHVNVEALGLIVLLCGLGIVVITVITKFDRPDVGISTGLLLTAAGTILAVAVRVELPYVATYAFGSALICAGVITLIATAGTIVGQRYRGRRHNRDGRRTENLRLVEDPESDPGPSLPPDLAVISDKDARKARRIDPR